MKRIAYVGLLALASVVGCDSQDDTTGSGGAGGSSGGTGGTGGSVGGGGTGGTSAGGGGGGGGGGVTGTVTDIDGNVYATVSIGEQVWMAENLNVTSLNDSTPIPLVEGDAAWQAHGATPAYCYQGDEPSNADPYGALYNWYAASSGSLCPDGWHVPSDADWQALSDHLGTDAGGALKESGIDHWLSPNTGATNVTGFTALPGGERTYIGQFRLFRELGTYWSASDSWARTMVYNNANLQRESEGKGSGFSVRCLQDPG